MTIRRSVLVALALSSCVIPEYTKDLPADETFAHAGGKGSVVERNVAGGSAPLGGTSQLDLHWMSTGGTQVSLSRSQSLAFASQGGGDVYGGATANLRAEFVSGGAFNDGSAESVAGGAFNDGGAESATGGAFNDGGAESATGGAFNDGSAESVSGGASSGVGAPACDVRHKSCAGICDAEIASDPSNCGDCGRVCGGSNGSQWSCVAYNCVVEECLSGFGNCDDRSDNGCEQLLSDWRHCGGCGVRCDYPVCGQRGDKYACLPLTSYGFDGTSQGGSVYLAQGTLHGFLLAIGSQPDPTLVSVSVVERTSDTAYYVALYESESSEEPTHLAAPTKRLWLSELQNAQGSDDAPFRNEIRLPSPLDLVPEKSYWRVILVASGQLRLSTGPEQSIDIEDYVFYADGSRRLTEMPADLSQFSLTTSTRRSATAIALRIAHR